VFAPLRLVVLGKPWLVFATFIDSRDVMKMNGICSMQDVVKYPEIIINRFIANIRELNLQDTAEAGECTS
jgi:hypothetical protein